MTSVTRLYRFSASHRLHLQSLSEPENSALYGKCNNPYGHGHDYILEVTCLGDADPVSGLLVPTAALDRFVQTVVLRHFASRNINKDVPEFATLVPTTENIALVIARMLGERWTELGYPGVRLSRIHLQETGRNGFELITGNEIYA